MTNRERWVIYPLLFFSLLLAARDDIVPPDPMECNTLICNRVLVRTPDERPLVDIGGNVDSGVVHVYGPEDAPVIKVGHEEALGLSGLLALSSEGDPLSDVNCGDDEIWGATYAWQSPPAEKEDVAPEKQLDSSPKDDVEEETTADPLAKP